MWPSSSPHCHLSARHRHWPAPWRFRGSVLERCYLWCSYQNVTTRGTHPSRPATFIQPSSLPEHSPCTSSPQQWHIMPCQSQHTQRKEYPSSRAPSIVKEKLTRHPHRIRADPHTHRQIVAELRFIAAAPAGDVDCDRERWNDHCHASDMPATAPCGILAYPENDVGVFVFADATEQSFAADGGDADRVECCWCSCDSVGDYVQFRCALSFCLRLRKNSRILDFVTLRNMERWILQGMDRRYWAWLGSAGQCMEWLAMDYVYCNGWNRVNSSHCNKLSGVQGT